MVLKRHPSQAQLKIPNPPGSDDGQMPVGSLGRDFEASN